MKSRVFVRLETTGLMQVSGGQAHSPVPKTRKVAKEMDSSIACHKFTCSVFFDKKCFLRCHFVCFHDVSKDRNTQSYVTVTN